MQRKEENIILSPDDRSFLGGIRDSLVDVVISRQEGVLWNKLITGQPLTTDELQYGLKSLEKKHELQLKSLEKYAKENFAKLISTKQELQGFVGVIKQQASQEKTGPGL